MPVKKENIPAIIGDLEPRKIYPVTEEELEILENSSNGSFYLNFAIALLSFAISTTISIYTTENSAEVHPSIFGIMMSGYAMGALCLLLWVRQKKNQKGF